MSSKPPPYAFIFCALLCVAPACASTSSHHAGADDTMHLSRPGEHSDHASATSKRANSSVKALSSHRYADDIRAVIRTNRKDVECCYEARLKDHPKLAGQVRVKFTIDSDGTVRSAKMQASSLHNADVEHCVIKKILKWQFPKPKGSPIVVVHYPFRFSTNP